MKNLLLGVAVLVLIAIGGFIYRNAVSRPPAIGTACTLDAKLCPDGSSVARVAPACDFAPCPPPNITLDSGLTFALPEGFVVDENALGADPTLLGAYVAPSVDAPTETITIRDYPITAEGTATDLIRSSAIGDASGAPVSPTAFSAAHLGSSIYTMVVLGRFEGVVHVAYYFPRATDVLRFEATDQGVARWTDSSLDLTTLPANAALRAMLNTIQIN